jgi:glutaminyl-tRNA synthetase
MTTAPTDAGAGSAAPAPKDFIRERLDADLQAGKNAGQVVTRFPPEPNGYLHIGHAKSICLNFGIAQEYPGARCHLRFDDTNPVREDVEYVNSIQEDVRWLGFDWGSHLYYASDYFEKVYEYAVALIKLGKAYVCDLSFDDIQKYRGAPNIPGQESPFRNRSVEENLRATASSARRSIWPRRISTCATRSFTAFARWITIAPARSGASTRSTTLPIASRT